MRIVIGLGLVCGISAPAVADTLSPIMPPAASTLVYLNRNANVVVDPADQSNSIAPTLQSNLIGKQITTVGWATDDATWASTLQCVQQTWAPFAVTITDKPPAPGTPHVEVLIGGSPFDIGTNPAFSGVAPMHDDCSIVADPVVFVFPDVLDGDVIRTCGIIAQETAHTFGLDHELLAGDPMSYLAFAGQRVFKDELAACGEQTARQCGPTRACGEMQNSVEMLAQRVGFAGGQALGTISITAPADKATVPEVFEVTAVTMPASSQVTGAHLYIDGEKAASQAGPGPFAFHTPSLADGPHEIDLVADAGDEHFETSEIVNVAASANDANALGCNAGGGGAGLATLGLVLGATWRARRRRG